MSKWILGVLALGACGGNPKPAPQPVLPAPPAERTIDCTRLTDHTIDVMLVGSADSKEDLAARRAKLLADCPKAWHADHPSANELKTTDCMMAAKDSADIQACVGLPPPTVDVILHTPKSGIAECDDYAAKMEHVLHCERLAKATRDQLRDGFVAATTGWATIPDDAKPKLAQDCAVGVSALKQIASSMKCDL